MRWLNRFLALPLLAVIALILSVHPAHAQQLSKRLILKDGSYQLATQWEVKGDRVRYLSAERNEWEELPNDLVDWDATDKFAKERAAGVPDAEAVKLDKEIAEEREVEEAKRPQVAPGLHLPDDGSVMLLDTFQGRPQLVELPQNLGALNQNRTQNVLRAAINPIANRKQSIELPGQHAIIQSHATLPSIYVNLDKDSSSLAQSPSHPQQAQGPQQPEQPEQAEQPWDRFHIVRTQAKGGKRIIAEVKMNPLGKVNQEQNVIPTTSQRLTGGWVKVTPVAALEPGEYAVVELLGKEGMNTYVWDFGVNPSAPANAGALQPEPAPTAPPTQSKE
jgi:hypothetical protein